MILATIIGNLGRDAEVKPINDKQYLSFSVASTEKRNNEEVTTWVSVLYPYQESLIHYLKKGRQVFVQGRMTAKIYQSQNNFGIDLSVFAQTLQLCGGKKEESASAGFPSGTQSNQSPYGSTVSGASAAGNQAPFGSTVAPAQHSSFPTPEEEQNDGLPF